MESLTVLTESVFQVIVPQLRLFYMPPWIEHALPDPHVHLRLMENYSSEDGPYPCVGMHNHFKTLRQIRNKIVHNKGRVTANELQKYCQALYLFDKILPQILPFYCPLILLKTQDIREGILQHLAEDYDLKPLIEYRPIELPNISFPLQDPGLIEDRGVIRDTVRAKLERFKTYTPLDKTFVVMAGHLARQAFTIVKWQKDHCLVKLLEDNSIVKLRFETDVQYYPHGYTPVVEPAIKISEEEIKKELNKIAIKEVVEQGNVIEGQLHGLKPKYQDRMRGARIQMLDGKYKDYRGVFIGWNGTTCYIKLDEEGKKSVPLIRKVRVYL